MSRCVIPSAKVIRTVTVAKSPYRNSILASRHQRVYTHLPFLGAAESTPPLRFVGHIKKGPSPPIALSRPRSLQISLAVSPTWSDEWLTTAARSRRNQ